LGEEVRDHMSGNTQLGDNHHKAHNETHQRKEKTNKQEDTISYEMHTHANELHIRILAASAATREEVEAAKQRKDDGSKPVVAEKRPYRPKPMSRYEEPEYLPDDDDTLEVLYRNGGIAISKTIKDIGERSRESIIKYDE
jgi:hypothetical protein